MNDKQKLIVARDQFALKNLGDDALKRILPAYKAAIRRIAFQLANLPEMSIERELRLKSLLQTIDQQFLAVQDQMRGVIPEAQADAFEHGLENARQFLTQSEQITAGDILSVTEDTSFISAANPRGEFVTPSITRSQVYAAAQDQGFSVFGSGANARPLADLLPDWRAFQVKEYENVLREGFLTGRSTQEIVREFGPLGRGRKGWAMTETLVRTAMHEASDIAHNAFWDANDDFSWTDEDGKERKVKLIKEWEWDATNDTRLCPICAPLDEQRYARREDAPKVYPDKPHWGCRCKVLPVTETSDRLDEAEGSFLERKKVEYYKDANGNRRRRPPEKEWDGRKVNGKKVNENAYARPQRIQGEYYWVRRRDMDAGKTSAGHMLQAMESDENKLPILGSKAMVKEWNRRIKQARYANDPQQLVRDLLGGR